MAKFFYTLLSLAVFFFFVSIYASYSQALPSDVQKKVIADGFTQPTAIAQSPDGRIFVLEKGGVGKIVKNGAVLPTPFINLPVNTDGERGLLGIAFDPGFATNNLLYLYYVNKNPVEIRVSRFKLSGNVVDIGSEKILLKSTQQLGSIHHAGTLRIGQDGKLWISVGNNANNANSQDITNIHGKILRINTDGSIPQDNPFVGRNGAAKEIWAYGLRNPFRFNFLPDGKPIVGDVGEATTEEVNIIIKGGNYGWPNAEGSCTNCPYINPSFSYVHNNQSASITGGFVYIPRSAEGGLPKSYANSYFYGDYAKGFIRRLMLDADGMLDDDQSVDDTAGAVVDLLQGNDDTLYFITIYPGTLYQISKSNVLQPPTAVIDAKPIAGLAPLTVSFSSKNSFDPQDKQLTYAWDFGDNSSAKEANPTHTYYHNGTYNVRLVANNGQVISSAATQKIIVGNEAPKAVIDTPVADAKYNAGDTISFSGSATDNQDGELPGANFSWEIVFHHQTHTHPFLGPITGVKSGTFTIPDTGESLWETSYEILLSVTDKGGLKTTTSKTIFPNISTLTFSSEPAGLSFTLDGIPHTTPYAEKSVVGFKRTVDVSSPQIVSSNNYDFVSWSDKGNKTHTINTPATDTKYTISFTKAGTGTGHVHFRVREFDADGKLTGKFINGATAKLTDTNGNTAYATQTSKTINNEDGWVYFDNVSTGSYGVLVYQAGLKGVWKQTTCEGAGTGNNASMQNINTAAATAAWQSPITVTTNQITWCKDVGLQANTMGNLFFRIRIVDKDQQAPVSSGTVYKAIGEINGATVKLTDTTGKTVIQTATSQTSPSGESGWVFFNNVPAGTYGILAYKSGFTGFWKQTGCNSEYEINSSINNENTQGASAAWNNNVVIVAGMTNYCHDLGLIQGGHLHFRVRDIDGQGNWTGKFINGVSAKLTDPSGATVIATSTSSTKNNEEGWVYFDNILPGSYGVLSYKNGLVGNWKQTTCDSGATTDNASIQNTNTEGATAAWQSPVSITANQITWCKDVGLKDPNNNPLKRGHVHFRVREFGTDGTWTGKFINGATAKLTSPDGTNVIAQAASETKNNEDGWVYLDFVPVGSYGILTYKTGYAGTWKQTDCASAGSTQDATMQNANTEGVTAAWQNNVGITENQVAWCKDLGLKAQ